MITVVIVLIVEGTREVIHITVDDLVRARTIITAFAEAADSDNPVVVIGIDSDRPIVVLMKHFVFAGVSE